jgi:signal transduction histidine kinase
VLGFSQLEHGNISVDVRVGALDEELRKLAERVNTALERAGASLTLDVASDLSARFDPDALARILANLLDNAEKYSRGAADRTITLATQVVANGVEVAVSDHGPGLSPDIGAKLFRPFVRGGAPDAPAGLGLGLALSRALARAMGGELTHRVNPGGGAVFFLLLAPP